RVGAVAAVATGLVVVIVIAADEHQLPRSRQLAQPVHNPPVPVLELAQIQIVDGVPVENEAIAMLPLQHVQNLVRVRALAPQMKVGENERSHGGRIPAARKDEVRRSWALREGRHSSAQNSLQRDRERISRTQNIAASILTRIRYTTC